MRVRNRWLAGSGLFALVVYAALWIGYARGWVWLARIDSAALEGAYPFGAAHVSAWDVLCTVLGPAAFRLAVLAVILVALWKRHVRLAVFLVLSVELSGLVTEAAKYLAGRPRPETALVDAWGTSFPSGHALGVMVAVAALLAVTLPVVAGRARGWLTALGVVVVLIIGIGRVVLNVHHPSDVVAGWALGYAYFVGCLLLVPPRPSVRQPDETPAALGTAR